MGAVTQAAALEPSRIKRRDVQAGLSPVRTSTPGPIWSPIYDTLLLNTSRTRPPTLAPHPGRTRPGRIRPRRHACGWRTTGRAGRACRRLVILEVRRVLELILGPSHFELGHGRIITAGGHGAAATSSAAASAGRNGLKRAHVDRDVFLADA